MLYQPANYQKSGNHNQLHGWHEEHLAGNISNFNMMNTARLENFENFEYIEEGSLQEIQLLVSSNYKRRSRLQSATKQTTSHSADGEGEVRRIITETL